MACFSPPPRRFRPYPLLPPPDLRRSPLPVLAALAALALLVAPTNVGEQELASAGAAGELTAGAPQPLGAAPKPIPGQKRAPCTEGVEIEATGFCWAELKASPPKCPPPSVAALGKCLMPTFHVPGTPTSVAP